MDGAISFVGSHALSASGGRCAVRASLGGLNTGRGPLFLFLGLLVLHSRPRLWLFLTFRFLVSGFSAVLNLRQEFADMFKFCFGPGMDPELAKFDHGGSRNFLSDNVATESLRGDSQLLRNLASGQHRTQL